MNGKTKESFATPSVIVNIAATSLSIAMGVSVFFYTNRPAGVNAELGGELQYGFSQICPLGVLFPHHSDAEAGDNGPNCERHRFTCSRSMRAITSRAELLAATLVNLRTSVIAAASALSLRLRITRQGTRCS